MIIKKVEVLGLLGRPGTIQAEFNDDINIVTGKNGAGKTSLLKLIWYIISGNILLGLREVDFKRLTIVTDKYECTIHRLSRVTCKIDFLQNGKRAVFEDVRDSDGELFENAEDYANEILVETGSSLFLPTFRRIEGGFTLNTSGPRLPIPRSSTKGEIEEALSGLSLKLTNKAHIFVTSISTSDIVELLLREYANLSEQSASLQQSIHQSVIEQIKTYKSDKDDVTKIDAANLVLDEVRAKIESMEAQRSLIMSPISAVQTLVQKLFSHSGILINQRLSFGDAASAVNSDLLSAGEKQMLSFICYNAFKKNSIVFIDEPELSLHVDWQRQLFPILLGQKSSNQFIIATHSPFIYSKYPDKGIVIDSDRGNSEDEI